MLVLGVINAQPCNKRYKKWIESRSKLIECRANYTLEKTATGSWLAKHYCTINDQLTIKASYKDKSLKVLNGAYFEAYDDGTIVSQGKYADNLKQGEWQELDEIGNYKDNKRTGEWVRTDEKGRLTAKSSFNDGVLHGMCIKYDTLGNEISRLEFDNGQLITPIGSNKQEKVEQMPRLAGCEQNELSEQERNLCSQQKLLTFMYSNINYPEDARKRGIEGLARVQFVVTTEGKIEKIEVLNGLSEDISQEILRILSRMPQWVPGRQDGKAVNVYFTLPVRFKLQ